MPPAMEVNVSPILGMLNQAPEFPRLTVEFRMESVLMTRWHSIMVNEYDDYW
jgi:hypothetical protein